MNTMKRKMKEIDSTLMKVACDMEYIIGSNCYNSKYENESYRYPVRIPTPRDRFKFENYQWNLNNHYEILKHQWDHDNFSRIHYKFGSNELRVGKAVLEILNYLEKHFGIDFEELEK